VRWSNLRLMARMCIRPWMSKLPMKRPLNRQSKIGNRQCPSLSHLIRAQGLRVVALVSLAIASVVHADQLPNPTVTASARPFNASFTAVNLFDSANAEYASLSQGAVSAPFTTNTLDGTWVAM
jgi:hypothetical protein